MMGEKNSTPIAARRHLLGLRAGGGDSPFVPFEESST